VPEFHRPRSSSVASVTTHPTQLPISTPPREGERRDTNADGDTGTGTGAGVDAGAADSARSSRRRIKSFAALAAVTVAVVAAGAAVTWITVPALSRTPTSTSALDLFWAPVVESSTPALLCIGDTSRADSLPSKSDTASLDTADEGRGVTTREFMQRNVVRYTDAVTLAQLTGELRARQKPFRIRRPETTGFADLRDGPVVLVGGFNNAWTMRLSDGLRFTLAGSADGERYILDRQNPASRQWNTGNRSAPLAALTETYGLITRVVAAHLW
jgi:hypothetical protein